MTDTNDITDPLLPDNLFPHPCDNNFATRILYREQYLRRFSAHFRDDPDWTTKLDDSEYFFQKLQHARNRDKLTMDLKRGVSVWSQEDAEFVWRELVERYRPFVVKCSSKFEPSIDGVWKKDGLVDEAVWKSLIEAVKPMENIPREEKLWRGYCQGPIYDLVHPSYWPIIYGRTISSDGKIIQPPPGPEPPSFANTLAQYHDPEIKKPFSHKFCWLPSEFEISEDGKVKISSYINGLATEEQQKVFYPIFEKIFEGFVPLFNHVLADLLENKSELRRVRWDDDERSSQLNGDRIEKNSDGVEEHNGKEKDPSAGDWRAFSENFNFDQFKTAGADAEDIFVEPESAEQLKEMWIPPSPDILEKVKLEGKTVKVIVKMIHIALTLDRPWHDGGQWRVEGTKNERVVASGVYCYQHENITEVGLGFRRGFKAQREEKGFFELMSYDTCQVIGNVELRENRGVAFPNIYHHRDWACCLLDETKPGYAKLLVFLLCDPSEDFKIETTRTVPAQQPEAREERIRAFRLACAGKLPPELIYETEGHIPAAISKLEAQEYDEKCREDGVEWTEYIQKSGGDPTYYTRSKPINGKSFDRICKINACYWTPFTTRW